MLKKSGILTILSLVGSLISAVNQLVIAKSFGSSSELSSYLIATATPLFLAGTIVIAFDYSLSPILVRQNNKTDVSGSRSATSTSVLVLAMIVSLLGYCSTTIYYLFLDTSQPSDLFLINLSLAYILCFCQILVGYLKCIANAHFKFIVPFVASSIPNFFIIISCLLFAESVGTPSILIGLLAGNLLGISVIIYTLGSSKIIKFPISLEWDSEILQYYKGLPLVFVGMLAFTVFSTIDIIWIPSLGLKKLAYVNYCQKILATAGTLIIAGPSAILSPLLAKQLLNDSGNLFLNTVEKSIRLGLLIASFTALFLVVNATKITQLLFERGNFTHTDTLGVAGTLGYFGFAIIPLVSVILIFRALMAKQDIRSGAIIGLVCSGSYFVFSGIFKNVYDIHGIGIAYVCCWLATLVVGAKLLWREKLPNLGNSKNAVFILKLISINVIYVSTLTFCKQLNIFSFSSEIMDNLFDLAFSFVIGCFTFIILLFVFRVEENSLIKRVLKKQGQN